MVGLPLCRWGRPGPRLMAFLTSGSVGVLLFIFYDVIRNASETVEAQVSQSATGGALFLGEVRFTANPFHLGHGVIEPV